MKLPRVTYTPAAVRAFFMQSEFLDHLVLRPLSHIRPNWETTWDDELEAYAVEENSFAAELNMLVEALAQTQAPARYHDSEDRLAQFAINNLKWPLYKKNGRWFGANYEFILESGSLSDADRKELLLAAAGRIQAALARGQAHIDEMEESHRRMLGAVLCIAIYRTS